MHKNKKPQIPPSHLLPSLSPWTSPTHPQRESLASVNQNPPRNHTGLRDCVIPGVSNFSFCRGPSVELWRDQTLVLHISVSHFLSSGRAELRLKTHDKMWPEAADGSEDLSTKTFFSGHLLSANSFSQR